MAVALNGRARLCAVLLVLPLAGFVGVAMLAPLATMLLGSVRDPAVVADALPDTLALLRAWDGASRPPPRVYAAAARELSAAREAGTLGRIATRVDRVYGQAGLRRVLIRSTHRLRGVRTDDWRAAMVQADPAWTQWGTWRALRDAGRAGERWSWALGGYYYSSSGHAGVHTVDGDRGPLSGVFHEPAARRVDPRLLGRTLLVSLAVAATCLLLGYPLAWLIAHAPPRRAALLLVGVLLPFWASLLVRSTSSIVLRQSWEVVGSLYAALGGSGDGPSAALIHGMGGTVIGMTHVLLPFMVLPLYAVMRTIRPEYLRAAASLGARPSQAFRRVGLPQSLPGVAAGTLLVFVVALGYRFMPTWMLVLTAYDFRELLDWGLAAALGGILLTCALICHVFYDRVVRIHRRRPG